MKYKVYNIDENICFSLYSIQSIYSKKNIGKPSHFFAKWTFNFDDKNRFVWITSSSAILVKLLIANIKEDIPMPQMQVICQIRHDARWRTLIMTIWIYFDTKTSKFMKKYLASLKRYYCEVFYQSIKCKCQPSTFSIILNFVWFCTN